MRQLARLIVLQSALILAQTLSFTIGPVLQNVGPGTATIWWLDVRSGRGELHYSLPSEKEEVASATFSQVAGFAGLYRYEARLEALEPGQEYSYRACIDTLCTSRYSFRTDPDPEGDEPVVILGVGDTGSAPWGQAAITANAMLRFAVGASKFLDFGDMTHSTSRQEFQDFLRDFGPLLSRLDFRPVLGNHDAMDFAVGKEIIDLQSLPCEGVPQEGCGRYGSFDSGAAHFVALDTTDWWRLQPDSRMLRWLANDLAATKKRWIVVYLHHPPYLTGFHAEDDNCVQVRQNVVPILEQYGVDLVLSGHEHGYQRTYPLRGGEVVGATAGGITYVVSGGGGSPLYDADRDLFSQAVVLKEFNFLRITVRKNSLSVQAIDLDGKVLDHFRSRTGVRDASTTEDKGQYARHFARLPLSHFYTKCGRYRTRTCDLCNVNAAL